MQQVRRTPYSTAPVEPFSGPFGSRWWWMPDLAFSAFRVVVGLMFAWHGAQELFGVLLPPGARWAGAPQLWSEPWIDAAVRFFFGSLLAVGLFTRLSAIFLAVLVTLTAIVTASGPRLTPAIELAVLYTVTLLALSVTGPGLFSIEWFVQSRLATRRRINTVSMSPWIRRQYRRRELAR